MRAKTLHMLLFYRETYLLLVAHKVAEGLVALPHTAIESAEAEGLSSDLK